MTTTTNNKAIYKFFLECGRMGDLYGVFVAPKEEVQQLIDSGEEVYFGEVLGKHSEISSIITSDDIEMATDNPEFVKMFEDLGLETGFNPFDYICKIDA